MDETFVVRMDKELIKQDVPLYARPFRVVMAYMDENKISGDFLAPEMWTPLMAIYKRLYPGGSFGFPPMLVGGVGFRDRFYLANVNIGYGTFSIDPLKQIEISRQELEIVWKQSPDEVWRAMYCVADLVDFGYSIDDLHKKKKNDAADELLQNARSSIEATARTLASGSSVDAAVQSICLAAELGMKGTLAYLGTDAKGLKALSHKLPDIATAVATARPAAGDAKMIATASGFPDYVKTRYSSHGLSRVALNELAMKAQYLAAESVRRISDRNLAGDIEADTKTPARQFP